MNTTQFITGKDGFIWFTGVVESRDDPDKLGRVRVRAVGYHTEDKTDIPTEDLPWALCLQPNNTPNLYATLRKGDMVVGFFLDSHSAQEPVILGYLPGKITDGYDYENSFSFAPPSRTFEKVKKISQNYSNILVILDSNHTDEHVLKELNLYGSLVSQNSYCIVFDTIIEKMDDAFSKDRPWSKKNSPKSAIEKFLKTNESFEIDNSVDDRLILSMAPGGFLKKIR